MMKGVRVGDDGRRTSRELPNSSKKTENTASNLINMRDWCKNPLIIKSKYKSVVNLAETKTEPKFHFERYVKFIVLMEIFAIYLFY